MKNIFFAILFATTTTVTTTTKGVTSSDKSVQKEFPENETTEEVKDLEQMQGKHSLDEIDLFSPTAAPPST